MQKDFFFLLGSIICCFVDVVDVMNGKPVFYSMNTDTHTRIYIVVIIIKSKNRIKMNNKNKFFFFTNTSCVVVCSALLHSVIHSSSSSFFFFFFFNQSLTHFLFCSSLSIFSTEFARVLWSYISDDIYDNRLFALITIWWQFWWLIELLLLFF